MIQSSKTEISQKYVVTGHVQGVFYRQSTQQKAIELGLSGWVQNLPNGDVLVCAKGALEKITQLEAWLKIGPPAASVSKLISLDLTQEEITQLGLSNSFTVLR